MTQSSHGGIVARDVRRACQELAASGEAISVTAVARHLHTSRATLYRHPELRAVVDEIVATPAPSAEGPHRPVSGNMRRRVEEACAGLLSDGKAVTFVAVADRSGLGRATLYRHPELRDLIGQLRWGPAPELTTLTQSAGLDDVRSELLMLRNQINRQEMAIRHLISVAQQPAKTA